MRVSTIIVSAIISLLILIGSFQTVEAKTIQNSFSTQNLSIEQSNPPKGRIIEIPDIDPMYPGGTHEMTRFISNSLKYPREAAEKDIQGLVVYNFVVELDGSLSNFEIMHRAHPLLDEEALRIIKSMPAWRPAVYKGENVRSTQYVPMYFKLNKNARTTTAQQRKVIPIDPNEEIFTIVDKMPEFPTGEEGLGKFISEFIQYPVRAKQEGIQGRILCAFIVRKDGTISNLEVINGLDNDLDNEALRVLSMMPKWSPGIDNNKPVSVKCILPIDFKIDETTAGR
ncbi:MAG: energy transducer TonB [Dysgonamonadaceae bacterium]|nr:energy transducer TonB [Dysgonamonadaceae bacterium]MDD4728752.1 energy transducer TonB [Dysgonamonadaceae bacterium]